MGVYRRQSPLSFQPWHSNPPPLDQRVHDEDLYFDDGNIVMMVKDRLFKVHCSVLKRKSTFFADLLGMPQDESQQSPGSSDEDPLVLYDSDADCFHNMLYVVYDFRPNHHILNNICSALDAACMAHKYGFESVEDKLATAACNLIEYHHREVAEKYGPTHLIDVAEIICFPSMRDRGMDCLKLYLSEGRLDIYDILRIASETEYRWDLLGWAYYQIMLLGSANWPRDDRLTKEHRRNLYRGSFRLQELWSTIVQNGVPCEHQCGVEHAEDCPGLDIWRDEAKKVVIGLNEDGGVADILNGMKILYIKVSERFLYLCLLSMTSALFSLCRTLALDLWKYFTEDDVDKPVRVISHMFW